MFNRSLTIKPIWVDLIKFLVRLILLVIVLLVIRHYFFLPDVLRQENAEIKQDNRAATGELSVTKDTIQDMEDRGNTQNVTREIIRENTYEIRNAPGASDETPTAVYDAFEHSITRLREQANQRTGTPD